MGELSTFLMSKYTKRVKANEAITDKMNQSKVKDEILRICSEHIKEPGQIFVFEVSKKYLQYAVEVITDQAIAGRYYIEQVSETCFRASSTEILL